MQKIGRTALMEASHDGHAMIVKELLKAKADVNICDKVGHSFITANKNKHTHKSSDVLFVMFVTTLAFTLLLSTIS